MYQFIGPDRQKQCFVLVPCVRSGRTSRASARYFSSRSFKAPGRDPTVAYTSIHLRERQAQHNSALLNREARWQTRPYSFTFAKPFPLSSRVGGEPVRWRGRRQPALCLLCGQRGVDGGGAEARAGSGGLRLPVYRGVEGEGGPGLDF